jgi:hypothetical protein
MPNHRCDECQRLWQEYAKATTDHLKFDSKLQVAAYSHDAEAIRVVTHQVEGAEEQREWTREAIRNHEATAHAIRDAAAD